MVFRGMSNHDRRPQCPLRNKNCESFESCVKFN